MRAASAADMDLRRHRLRPQPSTHGALPASGVVPCLRRLLRPPLQLVAVRSGVLELLDAYYTELAGHCDRTARLVRTLARQVGCPPGDVAELEMAALLHDLGKVLLPREILDEARLFSRWQIRAVRAHPARGAGLLLATGRNLPATFLDAVAHHDERWDGEGYPAGLLRHEIPFAARLVAVADAYDAMTSPRPYRRLLTTSEARLELLGGAGSQFDPTLVLALLAHSLDVPFPGSAS
jgi:HD-GYP domain-containing protein (c-di-GMP phosphodiesterase class II)